MLDGALLRPLRHRGASCPDDCPSGPGWPIPREPSRPRRRTGSRSHGVTTRSAPLPSLRSPERFAHAHAISIGIITKVLQRGEGRRERSVLREVPTREASPFTQRRCRRTAGAIPCSPPAEFTRIEIDRVCRSLGRFAISGEPAGPGKRRRRSSSSSARPSISPLRPSVAGWPVGSRSSVTTCPTRARSRAGSR